MPPAQDSLWHRFGPKALTLVFEKLIGMSLPYLLPIAMLLWAKGWVWLELLWRSLRSGIGL